MKKNNITYKPRFTWNENIISYFVDLYNTDGEHHMFNRIIEYVKYECQLEDGETHQDLISDLTDRVFEAIEIDDKTL